MASDLYQLRNQITHGDRIREKYMNRCEFRFEPSELECLRIEDWTYQSLLLEAALFTLVADCARYEPGNLIAEPYASMTYVAVYTGCG